jgi:hypothetical protein
MNTVALPVSHQRASGGLPRFVLDCWRALDWRHWGAALLAGAVIAVITVLTMIEYVAKLGAARLIAWAVAMPVGTAILVLLAWAIADRIDEARMRRPLRIALAVVAGAGVGVSLSMLYFIYAGMGEILGADWIAKGRVPPSTTAILLGEWFNAVVNCSLFVVAGEVYRSRVLLGQAAESALREQATMARDVLEARLAAMQAQVEPRFLFDSLVDIRKLYEHDGARGAGTLDQLITFLRVALPRLRESGSTLGAEVDLVTAYVAVVAARHGGLPRFVARVEPECLAARFSPMLLLPLVQRAVRTRDEHGAAPAAPAAAAAASIAASIELAARRDGDMLVAEVRFAAAGLCRDDEDLARVHQRLAGLYAGRATLDCAEPEPGTTVFTLRLPHERNAPDAERTGAERSRHAHERSEPRNVPGLPVLGADRGGR